MYRTRNELSKKNKYYIPKHRYLELKHFCLQYNDWKKRAESYISSSSIIFPGRVSDGKLSDRTGELAVVNADLDRNSRIVKEACERTDRSLSKYIFIAVTQGLSFTTLKMIYEMPCEKDMYYDRYRRFFWVLDKLR